MAKKYEVEFKIRQVRFIDKKTNFTICEALIKKHNKIGEEDSISPITEKMIIHGYFYSLKAGDVFEGIAELKYDRKKGKKYLEIPRPRLVKLEYEEEVSAFLQRSCKSKNKSLSVGKRIADKIVETLGLTAISKIVNDKDCLLKIKGITKAKADFIYQNLVESKNYEELLTFLEINNLKTSLAPAIYSKFKERSVAKLKENPYLLYKILDNDEISFKEIDKVGLFLGMKFDSDERISAAILYYINDRTKSNGDLYVVKEDIYEELFDFLIKKGSFDENEAQESRMSQALFERCFDENLLDHSIAIEINEKGETCVYSKYYRFVENNIVKSLKRLLGGNLESFASESRVDEFIPIYEQKTGFPLAKKQKEAVYMAIKNPFSILTGGPGTGKTATTKAILQCITSVNPQARVLLLAPTGKAAKRMAESCERPALTIHRGLKLNPMFNKKATSEDLLNYDYIFIDEASMVDAELFSLLLERVTENTRIILIGDVDQLPSVGPGLILRDLINSRKIPVTILDELFRQAKDSQININSHKIIKGDVDLEIDQDNKKDFFFWNTRNIDVIKKRVIDCYKRCLDKGYSTEDICILTPTKEGELGTVEINKLIQKNFNNSDKIFKVDGMNIFKVNDRVMQIKNNYDLEVFNGEIGIIESIQILGDKVSIRVNYGVENLDTDGNNVNKIVTYDESNLEEIILAYCMTIHKSQGSEFLSVITIISNEHTCMLNRNLIYTAWTRAKEVVLNIGQREALKESIRSMEHMSRNSRVIEKLNKALR